MTDEQITLVMYVFAIGMFTLCAVAVAGAWGEISRWARLRVRCRWRVLFDVPAEPGHTVWLRSPTGALVFFVDGSGLGLQCGDRVYIKEEEMLSPAPAQRESPESGVA